MFMAGGVVSCCWLVGGVVGVWCVCLIGGVVGIVSGFLVQKESLAWQNESFHNDKDNSVDESSVEVLFKKPSTIVV